MNKENMPLFIGGTKRLLNNLESFLYVINYGSFRQPIIICKEKSHGIWKKESFNCKNHYDLFNCITSYLSKEDSNDIIIFNGFTRAQIASYNKAYFHFKEEKESKQKIKSKSKILSQKK